MGLDKEIDEARDELVAILKGALQRQMAGRPVEHADCGQGGGFSVAGIPCRVCGRLLDWPHHGDCPVGGA